MLICAACSLQIAFTQWLFFRLRKKVVAVRVIDAAQTASSSLQFLFSWELLVKLPDIWLFALAIGYVYCVLPSSALVHAKLLSLLIIPTTIVTPGSLAVTQIDKPNNLSMSLYPLAIESFSKATYFEVSRAANAQGSQSDQSGLLWLAYRTIISRLTEAAAAVGEILPLQMPAPNSSYTLNFYGPYVSCSEANDTVKQYIDTAAPQVIAQHENSTLLYNAYIGYVPDLSNPATMGQPIQRNIDLARGSNQLWLAFKQNGSDWVNKPYPQCPITAYRVCQLYNASYNVIVSFNSGSMTINYTQPTQLVPVDYPPSVVDGTDPAALVNMSYSAWMWSFTDLLVGSMGFYENFVGGGITSNFTSIDTRLQDTALLGSKDLFCFFDFSWYFDNKTWEKWGDQRDYDIAFAHNGSSFDQLIPELSVNLTLSLMNDHLLSTQTDGYVTIYSTVSIWAYHEPILHIAYGATFLAAACSALLGLVAFHYNGINVDFKFSTIASATHESNIIDDHRKSRGSIQPPEVRDKTVKFQPHTDGGWGFKCV